VDGPEGPAAALGEQQVRFLRPEQPGHLGQHVGQHLLQDQGGGEGLADLVQVLEAVAFLHLPLGRAVGQPQGGRRQQHGRQGHRLAQPQHDPDQAHGRVPEEDEGGQLGGLLHHLPDRPVLQHGQQLADEQQVDQGEGGHSDGHGGHAARPQQAGVSGDQVVQADRGGQGGGVHAEVEDRLDRGPTLHHLGHQQPGQRHGDGLAGREQGDVGHHHALVQVQHLQGAAVGEPQAGHLGGGREHQQGGQGRPHRPVPAARVQQDDRGAGQEAGRRHQRDEPPEPRRQPPQGHPPLAS
jgi:hypothetical protein